MEKKCETCIYYKAILRNYISFKFGECNAPKIAHNVEDFRPGGCLIQDCHEVNLKVSEEFFCALWKERNGQI